MLFCSGKPPQPLSHAHSQNLLPECKATGLAGVLHAQAWDSQWLDLQMCWVRGDALDETKMVP